MLSLSKASFLILLFFSMPIIFNINYILHLWLATDLPYYTGAFVNLVIVMSMIEALSPPVSFVVHASGDMAKYQLINSFITLLVLPVSYITLKLGADAVSVFWLGIIFQTLCQISSLIILKGIIKYSIIEYIKTVIIPLSMVVIISGICIWLTRCFFDEGLIGLICATIVSSISIALSSYLFVLDKKERDAVKTAISKVLMRND